MCVLTCNTGCTFEAKLFPFCKWFIDGTKIIQLPLFATYRVFIQIQAQQDAPTQDHRWKLWLKVKFSITIKAHCFGVFCWMKLERCTWPLLSR
jgi:hypothetical protein